MYSGRKLELRKDGTFAFESLSAEMDWYRYTREITSSTVYPLAERLIARDPCTPADTDIIASYICRAKFSPDSIEALYIMLTDAKKANDRGRAVAGYIEGRRSLTTGRIIQVF